MVEGLSGGRFRQHGPPDFSLALLSRRKSSGFSTSNEPRPPVLIAPQIKLTTPFPSYPLPSPPPLRIAALRERITSRWVSPFLSVAASDPSVMVQECCSSSSDSFPEAESGTPLSAVAVAFEDLARSIEGGAGELRLAPFTDACSLVSVLFGCLGFAFKFAEMEYVSKVNNLLEAAKVYDTLHSILDIDVNNDSVRKQGSRSRSLRRVRLGLDLIKALFEQFLSSDDCSLREAASTAYTQVCAPYHAWAIRKAVGAGMYALPTREELLLRLNENDHSVQTEMRRYIVACSPIIQYIDNLYLSRNISLDW